MAVVFTARLRVGDWRALRRLSDETLILYARAAGAQRYRLYRDAHDAAEALLLVEAASLAALRPLRDALLSRERTGGDAIVVDGRPGPPEGRLWEPADCRHIDETNGGMP
jgi:hypothetical protein